MLMEMLNPYGAYVVIEAEHMCMTMRGIKKPGANANQTKKVVIGHILKRRNSVARQALSVHKGQRKLSKPGGLVATGF